jgi:hypothetical protein
MLSRHFSKALLKRTGVRSIVSPGIVNAAVNDNPSYIHRAVLPFGFDFVDARLRKALDARGVDVDALEGAYGQQRQNDHEFNHNVLPREQSRLWPYAYGEWLARSQVRLDTLSEEEQFMGNYLKSLTTELEGRMTTMYPELDWRALVKQQTVAVNEEINEAFEDAYADATATIIARDPQKYIEFFKNNAFVPRTDDDDKYSDHFPRDVEESLAKRFEFVWDYASPSADPRKYFDALQKLDSALSVPVDAIGGDIRQGFNKFLLSSFSSPKMMASVGDLVKVVNGATSVAFVDVADARAEDLVDGIFEILEMSGASTVDGRGADIVGRLVFGSTAAGEQIKGESVANVKRSAAAQPIERLQLLRQALQIVQYLKRGSPSRLFLSVLMAENPSFVGQFLTDSEKLDAFISETVPLIEDTASVQRDYFEANRKLAGALDAFFNAVVERSGVKSSESAAFAKSVRTTAFSALISDVDVGEICPIQSSLRRQADAYAESGEVTRETQTRAYAEYLKKPVNMVSVYWYAVGGYILQQPEHGLSPLSLTGAPRAFAEFASEAQDSFFAVVTSELAKLGVTDFDARQFADEWAAAQEAGREANELLTKRNELLAQWKLNFDDVDFERVREFWNPFDVHLSQHRYFTPM